MGLGDGGLFNFVLCKEIVVFFVCIYFFVDILSLRGIWLCGRPMGLGDGGLFYFVLCTGIVVVFFVFVFLWRRPLFLLDILFLRGIWLCGRPMGLGDGGLLYCVLCKEILVVFVEREIVVVLRNCCVFCLYLFLCGYSVPEGNLVMWSAYGTGRWRFVLCKEIVVFFVCIYFFVDILFLRGIWLCGRLMGLGDGGLFYMLYFVLCQEIVVVFFCEKREEII